MKKFFLSWDIVFQDGMCGDVYDSMESALNGAEKGQYIHEVVAILHEVVFAEPTTREIGYS